MNDNITVPTPRCIHCSQTGELVMSNEDYQKGIKAYRSGAYVQAAFPNLNAAEREQLNTGIHPKCWDEIFADTEDED